MFNKFGIVGVVDDNNLSSGEGIAKSSNRFEALVKLAVVMVGRDENTDGLRHKSLISIYYTDRDCDRWLRFRHEVLHIFKRLG